MKRFLEFITEARTSQAAQQAHKLGYVGDGHGFWVDREGKKQAKTLKGKLEFIGQKKKAKSDQESSKSQSPEEVKSKKTSAYKSGPKRLGSKAKPSSQQKKSSTQASGVKAKGSQQSSQQLRDEMATVAFGKFNPPTKGHQNLFSALKQASSGGNFYIFPSRTQDGKKNPLDPDTKINYMKEMFPEYADRIIDSDEFKTIFDVLAFLNQEGYTTVNIIVGAERVSEIDNLSTKQNGTMYQFNSINVVSAGTKDPEESSAAARKSAASGDFESFKKLMPSSFKGSKKLFDDLGGSLEVKETWLIAPELDWKGLRENYIFGNLFNVGSIVESSTTGLKGEVIRSGANHLICVTNDGMMFKSWIKDVSEVSN
jgi:hypothetical protein